MNQKNNKVKENATLVDMSSHIINAITAITLEEDKQVRLDLGDRLLSEIREMDVLEVSKNV